MHLQSADLAVREGSRTARGRVVVEADGNEAQEIVTEEIRKEALDIVGPCGTPDDGYRNSMVKNAGNAFGRAYPLPPLPSGLANTLIRTFDVPPTPLTDLVSAIVLVERNLIDRGVVPAAIPLAFHALNNDIDVRRSTVDEVTGAAVAVFDTETTSSGQPHPGDALLTANRLVAKTDFAATLVVMVRRCTMTGNVITNDPSLADNRYGLVVVGRERYARVAVTGNVLTLSNSLPDRDPAVPSWISLNSQEI